MALFKKFKPEQALTLGYICSLSIIALLAGIEVVVQNRYITMEERASNALALMTNQQNLIMKVNLKYVELDSTSGEEERHRILEDIVKIGNQISEKHKILLGQFSNQNSQFWKLEDSVFLDRSEIDSYTSLDQSMRLMIAKLLVPFERNDDFVDLKVRLVDELSQIAKSYSQERKQKKERYTLLISVGYLLQVVFLILVGFFIFRPLVRHARSVRIRLQKTKTMALRASRVKTDFLANISHEIRTPLSGIQGYTDILLCDSELSEQQKDTVLSIKRSTRHLRALIDDILDLSKVEAGKLEIANEKFSLLQLVHEVRSIVDAKMKAKGVQFIVEFGSEIPEYVVSDPVRVTQVLVNIVGNAEKFTDQGSVKLLVNSFRSSNDDSCTIRMTVIDTGCGIEKSQAKKLFKRFSQIDSSLARREGGTGLGLVLSKHLAQMLNGDLKLVDSQVGKGSTFQFDLICKIPSGTSMVSSFEVTNSDPVDIMSESQISGLLDGTRILLVEDGEDNQRIFRYFLEKAGAEVISCWDGLAGLDHGVTTDDLDVILMDIQLPKMDGYAVTKELRARGVLVPIIALTAHAMQQEKDKCLSGGFTDYISKPVNMQVLLDTIRLYSGKVDSTPTPKIYSTLHNQDLYKPMIVEFLDSLDERMKLIRQAFEENDLEDLAKNVHKVKGAGGTYGFPDISSAAKGIEVALEKPSDERTLQSAMDHFMNICRSAIRGRKELG